jgi:saccharopine dehydrogenase (NAD+, L-lysine forming)
MAPSNVLIAGGYGVVGRRIAKLLAADYPESVILAGRNIERARVTASAIGPGVRYRAIDVTDPSTITRALEDVAVVISCVDQPGRKLLHAAIEKGLCYTDITPHLVNLGRGAGYERIDQAARRSGACIVLGTGIVPGISNVMVCELADQLGGAEEIDSALLLSAADVTGPASFDYFIAELAMPFNEHVGGADRPALPFSHPHTIEFPAPIGEQIAYSFPFSDQVLYPRTMNARTVHSRLALEPNWLATLLTWVVRSGAAHVLATDPIRHAIARRHRERAAKPDTRFALRVDVTHRGRSATATLVGAAQADAAAAGAIGVAQAIIKGEVGEPGAWMPEQVIDPKRFFSRLARLGLQVRLSS